MCIRDRSDPAQIAKLLVEQISSPVQWVSCVQTMSANNLQFAVECGPGNVLSGLMRRIDKSIGAGTIDSVAGLEKVSGLVAEL